MEYTKGEWKVGKVHTDMVHSNDYLETKIAHCYSPNSEANAQLIAAAPDLYEACREARQLILFLIPAGRIELQRDRVADILDKAIAKGEGK